MWGFLFWVVLTTPAGSLQSAPEQTVLMETLRDALPETGSYLVPLPAGGRAGEDPQAVLERYTALHVQGPIAMIHLRREGGHPMSPLVYARGFLHFFGSALLAALLLLSCLTVLNSFPRRAFFVFWVGLFATVAIKFSEPIWFHLPWPHYLRSALYHSVGWLLAGIVLGIVVRPRRGAVHDTDPAKPLWKRALDVD